MTFLQFVPPMGIYKTLYAFHKASGSYMGDAGTHPWSQGFPRTDTLPGGPEMPPSISMAAGDLRYPKAWGLPALRECIADYYRNTYNSKISSDNVMVFAGGRPGLVAVLMFLQSDISVRIASTEYTPYYDLLKFFKRDYSLIPSNEANNFRPNYENTARSGRTVTLMSNPCNPTGFTTHGASLESLVKTASQNNGFIFDEAYEFFHDSGPVSAMKYIHDIEQGNLFVLGAATKGLQAPGIRIGWVVTSKANVEILGNFSSFGMGGVSHLSQRYALGLLEPARVKKAQTAVSQFYRDQRGKYGEVLNQLGLKLYTGDGGFYHWCKLPGALTAAEFNKRLFKHKAAILEGTDCDMERLEEKSTLRQFFRFSFGPLDPSSFESDVEILKRALA